jgi:ABC-type glutathione transport system ATPase component
VTNPLLQVHLEAGYGKQCILNEVAFTLERGERMGLVGLSGGGKSTLVLALMALLPWRDGWAKGEVLLEGRDLLLLNERDARRVRGKCVSLVPQSPVSALNSALSLGGHFEEAWRAHEARSSEKLSSRLTDLLRQLQLPSEKSFLARKPSQISVGQAQRVVLALALLHRPALLIADEPTSALDPTTQVEILQLLRQVNRDDGTALLYISHDLLSVLQLCERVAVLSGGRIVDNLPARNLGDEGHHPATAALLRSLPIAPDVLLNSMRSLTSRSDRFSFCHTGGRS